MVEIGEIKKARELGIPGAHKMIYDTCIECGKPRWVRVIRKDSARCKSCAAKIRQKTHPNKPLYGPDNYSWRGGRRVTKDGYVLVSINPNNFFYPMATSNYNILEHRLVMAKKLGRQLHSWEIVHHINGNKQDNRLENLQLVSDDRHKQITILETKIHKLLQRQSELENQIKLLQDRNQRVKQVNNV